MQVLSADEMARLSPEQKADLIDQLWASWDKESLQLSNAQRAELDRRLEDMRTNPADELSWEEVKTQLLGKGH
jgi:putative addiction module component (TIGR02574 family)